ncbi:hypothetical protein IR215_01665 [Simulacricoccus sp. 17bor-14]|nr:hypothetical protein [Simulacricoccus sp. 17bor-14]
MPLASVASVLSSGLLAQAADAASRVGVGRIVGGWDFVGRAYGVAWAGLALYALSLWVRRPRTQDLPPAGNRGPSGK